MPNINTSGSPITSVKELKLFGMDENEEVGWIFSNSLVPVADYAAGIEVTQYNQLVRDENGEFWRVSGQVDLPYVATGAGIPEDDALVPVGDAVLRQDLANPGRGAAMVARGVLAVDSIADLLALPEGQRKEGLRYLVKGYHVGGDVGGGEFYWDADANKSSHEAGTIIDPDRSFPADWGVSSQVTAWLVAGTSGEGCFRRVQTLTRPAVTPEMYGAVTGSGFDCSDIFNHMFSKLKADCNIELGGEYYFHKPISYVAVTGDRLTLKGQSLAETRLIFTDDIAPGTTCFTVSGSANWFVFENFMVCGGTGHIIADWNMNNSSLRNVYIVGNFLSETALIFSGWSCSFQHCWWMYCVGIGFTTKNVFNQIGFYSCGFTGNRVGFVNVATLAYGVGFYTCNFESNAQAGAFFSGIYGLTIANPYIEKNGHGGGYSLKENASGVPITVKCDFIFNGRDTEVFSTTGFCQAVAINGASVANYNYSTDSPFDSDATLWVVAVQGLDVASVRPTSDINDTCFMRLDVSSSGIVNDILLQGLSNYGGGVFKVIDHRASGVLSSTTPHTIRCPQIRPVNLLPKASEQWVMAEAAGGGTIADVSVNYEKAVRIARTTETSGDYFGIRLDIDANPTLAGRIVCFSAGVYTTPGITSVALLMGGKIQSRPTNPTGFMRISSLMVLPSSGSAYLGIRGLGGGTANWLDVVDPRVHFLGNSLPW